MPCAGRGAFQRGPWARRGEAIRRVPRLRGSGRPAAPHRRGRKSALKTNMTAASSMATSDLRRACVRLDRNGPLDVLSLRPLGWFNAFAMLAALADLLILRPTVTFLSRLAGQIGGNRWHQLEPGQ